MQEIQISEDEISLNEIFHIIIDRFYIIVLALIVSIVGAIIFLHNAVNEYQTSVIMLVEPMQETSTIGKILSSDFFNNDNDISTEIQLIKNITNLNSAVKKLDLSKYENSEGFLYSNPNVLGPLESRVNISTFDDTNIVQITVKDENPQFAADFANALVQNFNEMLAKYGKESKTSQIEFLENQIPETEKELDAAKDSLYDYKAQTGIEFISNSTAAVVNHISYLQLRIKPLELQISKSDALVIEFQMAFNDQLPEFQDYKEDEKIQEILKTYEVAYNELILYDMISNNNYYNTTNLSVVNYNINASVNARIIELNAQMAESKRRLLNRIKSFTLEKGIIQSLSSNNYYSLSNYYFAIVDRLCSEGDIININKNINDFEAEFNKLPIIEKELSKLQGDVDSIEAIRKELNSLYGQLTLTSAAQNNNVKLVSPAIVPTSPVSPNKLLILAVSILLGLALGFLLCIILNMMDDKIHNIEDLKRLVGPNIPILGWTPLMINNNNTPRILFDVSTTNPNSYISERYKSITSNILYGKNMNNKVFTITSSTVDEGKSCLICNISICLSQLGYKVLIIDGDLRSPSIGKFFNIDKKKPGYISAIENGLLLEDVYLSLSKKNDNIHLLLPGESDLNTSVFYAHTNYHDSISMLRDKFDYIFIDSPPLGYASELLGLIRHVDSIILCARMSVVDKTNINILLDQLDEQKDKIGGVIASACPLSNVSVYSKYDKYDDYYHAYNNYSYNDELEDYSIVRTERKAIKIFKKNIVDRKKTIKKNYI